jgi:replicative DNA helicase
MDENNNIEKFFLHKDAEILLMNGTLKKVIDIEENDVLLGIPTYKNIVKKKYISKGNLYRIITRYGNSFIIGENTKFLTFNNTNLTFNHIDIKQYLSFSNDYKNTFSIHKTAVEYNEITLPIDPYFIGIFLGNVNKLFIKIKDDNNPSFIKSFEDTLDTLKLKKISSLNEHIISISDINLDDEIKNTYDFIFGSKYIPDVYKRNSIYFRRKLLTGIIDINSIQKSNYVEIRNLNKTLAFDIYNLLFSIGIFHVLIIKEKGCFNIQIFDVLKHIQFIKEYRPQPHIFNNFKVASIIEKEGVVIEVENYSSIVLSDFTIL